jgi:GH15 family glucan-1,4-alpha-glucosidase
MIWLIQLLDIIQKEYLLKAPTYHFSEPTKEDIEYITSKVSEDSFDELGLKKKMIEEYNKKNAEIVKCTSEYGIIFIVKNKWEPPFNTLWRCVRLLAKKSVRIVIFAHPNLRTMPMKGHHIKAQHINGGYANRCDSTSIVIYRKEEAVRVLLHELLHASCTDPYHKTVPEIEADTEAWAEIIQCAMAAEGNKTKWNKYISEQIEYSLRQAAALRDNHNVNSMNDYAWRYAIGRLEVWKSLGFNVGEIPIKYEPIQSLRLTIHEPKN